MTPVYESICLPIDPKEEIGPAFVNDCIDMMVKVEDRNWFPIVPHIQERLRNESDS